MRIKIGQVIIDVLRGKRQLIKKQPVTINYVELSITSRCTLCCKDCWHLMPHYLFNKTGLSKGGDVSLSYCKRTVDNLLKSVDHINNFCILGGEPLLHKDCAQIIEYLTTQSKITNVRVITNATISPNQEIINAMKHEKVYIEISDYGDLSRKKEEMLAIFKANNIKNSLRLAVEGGWNDIGQPVANNRDVSENLKIFSECSVRHCQLILDGKIFICPRSAHGINLGLHKNVKEEYVDLNKGTPWLRKKQIKKLYELQVVPSCDYCNGSSGPPIKAAIQLSAQDILTLKNESR